ncbi:MAG: hypothetical protein ACRD18_02585 [Terriglobia bacterium]
MKDNRQTLRNRIIWVIFAVALCAMATWPSFHLRKVKAAGPNEQMSINGSAQFAGNRIGVIRGSISDDAVILEPTNTLDGDILFFIVCSPMNDHSLDWPSNFISAPPTNLRKGSCISTSYIYDSNAQVWFPAAQPITYESKAIP